MWYTHWNRPTSELNHNFYPPKEVFQLIYADHEAAAHETPTRFSFLYIIFLDKSMFPLWLDRSLVGSKPPVMTQVDMAQNNMLEFGKEIVKAASGRPFFRSISHWVVMLWRWAIPAIGCNAWSLKAHLAYVDKIVHLSVKESMKSNMGMHISMLYDELERQEWMERTRKGDNSLDSLQKLEIEAGKIDERLLEAAKTKLPGVLEACADISSASSAPAQMGPPGFPQWSQDAMRQHNEMISQVGQRSEASEAVLTANCGELLDRVDALESSGSRTSGGAGGWGRGNFKGGGKGDKGKGKGAKTRQRNERQQTRSKNYNGGGWDAPPIKRKGDSRGNGNGGGGRTFKRR